MPAAPQQWTIAGLQSIIQQVWGYSKLRPLQEQAMRCVLDARDSLIVLPTGGGKSLCFQAPAVLQGGVTVVVSPLIALMKDQVDGLRASGIAARQMDSSQSSEERSTLLAELRRNEVVLLFVAPERLAMPGFQDFLRQRVPVRNFAIDEAHCISQWGHDFRPEYRQLAALREVFPDASVHAYTATATGRVQRDIIEQLQLHDPAVHVGNFDRPNLTYRVLPRASGQKMLGQVQEVLSRHKDEAGIIYCLSRKDVDDLAGRLKQLGLRVVAYHAGMSTDERSRAQDAFMNEDADLVVATVAFGMGIDRSDIRFVLHAKMPQSIEHYQQEAGRAGRDGLEAECVLLYSGGDFILRKTMIERTAQENGSPAEFVQQQMRHLEDMSGYCRGAVCRHKALVSYFGQEFKAPTCGACDICLGDTEIDPESQVIAQKVLSCVARVKEGFGVAHVVSVLRGENSERVRRHGHEQLSTFGLLRDKDAVRLRDWVYQLVAQGLLKTDEGEYPVLKLTPASWAVMKGQRVIKLLRPVDKKSGPARSQTETISWEGVDRPLFDQLREVRRVIAQEQKLLPFQVFNDATLRELARVRPTTPDRMRAVSGVGATKLRDFGERFLTAIAAYCQSSGVRADVASTASASEVPPPVRLAPPDHPAYPLYRRGDSIAAVAERLGKARGTAVEYLCDFIRVDKPATVRAWVPDDLYQRIAEATRGQNTYRLKPIHLALGEGVSYDDIRVVVTHMMTLNGM